MSLFLVFSQLHFWSRFVWLVVVFFLNYFILFLFFGGDRLPQAVGDAWATFVCPAIFLFQKLQAFLTVEIFPFCFPPTPPQAANFSISHSSEYASQCTLKKWSIWKCMFFYLPYLGTSILQRHSFHIDSFATYFHLSQQRVRFSHMKWSWSTLKASIWHHLSPSLLQIAFTDPVHTVLYVHIM